MEQADDFICVRISTCQIRTFVTVTRDAGQSKIAQSVIPTVLLCDDMFDVERVKRFVFLPQVAILATIFSPRTDPLPRRRIHGSMTTGLPKLLPRFCLEDRDDARHLGVRFIAPPL